MRLAIIGSRTFNDYNLLRKSIHIFNTEIDCIISGGAKGADSLAKQFAEEWHIEYVEFPAEWNKYGKAAGFRRNHDIVNACDTVLAFWDGKSRGTKHSLDLARDAKKPTFLVYF